MSMKTFAFSLLFLFSFCTFAQQPAKIKFDTELIDYGTVNYQGDGNRVFKFTNVGAEPLILSSVQSSCGCLVPTWSREPVKPGASAVIKVRYDTGRVGNFEKTVTVNSNADRPTVVLKIKGKVLPAPTDTVKVIFPVERH